MQRYFITLSYDGEKYHGWQIQPNGISVQGEIQRAFSVLLREQIEIIGAGRTDAGVHARMMVAHFDWHDNMIDCDQLTYKLNRLLPPDISIQSVKAVKAALHARFSAVSRTYYYYVHTHKDPFRRKYSCELHYKLDFEKMNEAARALMEYNDFEAFCKSHTDVKTTLCNVSKAEWVQIDNDSWYFVITANRFLRNMVRAIVGTLVEVGRGRVSISEFRNIIIGKKRSNAGESMPAKALFLENIDY